MYPREARIFDAIRFLVVFFLYTRRVCNFCRRFENALAERLACRGFRDAGGAQAARKCVERVAQNGHNATRICAQRRREFTARSFLQVCALGNEQNTRN